jgi:hypothetical protein
MPSAGAIHLICFDAGSFKTGLELDAAALLIASHDQRPSRDKPALSFARRDV